MKDLAWNLMEFERDFGNKIKYGQGFLGARVKTIALLDNLTGFGNDESEARLDLARKYWAKLNQESPANRSKSDNSSEGEG